MRIFTIVTFALFMSFESFAQVPDSVYYNRLFYTCKAWGHVKYFHTETANGSVNWDDELLNSIGGIKTAPDNTSFNDSLLSLLNSAGVMGTSAGFLPVFPDSLNNNTDQLWIQDAIFTSQVSAVLDTIRVRFRPQPNIYVGEAWAGGNPTFLTDNQYYATTSAYPSEEMRILALFRYWNCINYFYPYKSIMDQEWDLTLQEFIPQIVEANDAVAYNLAFRKLTARINDSHSFFGSATYYSWDGNYYPPFLVRFIENEMVITKVLPQVTSVSVGDVILGMDGETIIDLRDSLREYAHGSNDAVIERELNTLIMYGPTGSFDITVDNGTNIHTETLVRNGSNGGELNTNSGSAWRDTIINGNCYYGIVDLDLLESNQVSAMFADLWSTDAIIFDVRNYPNGVLWDVVEYLYSSTINIANFTTPDITHPGRLTWHYEFIGNGTANPYLGEVIILFNEETQSHAEYTCMSLEQFPNAVKIGSTTAGADGNVAVMYMPGNIFAYATFLGTYYPDFTETQRVGIIPDYEVLPTIQGIRSGQDEVLDFALNCALLEVDEMEVVSDLTVFPNPAVDEIEYTFTNEAPFLLEIVDMQGKKLRVENVNSLTGKIDISNLTKGLYVFKFHTNHGVQSELVNKI